MDTASLNALLNSGAILPELIVIGTLVLVLIVDLIASGRKSANVLPYIAIAGLVATTAALVWQWTSLENPIAFLGSFNSDKLSIIFRGIIVLSTLFTILVSIRYLEPSGVVVGEYLVILLSANLGAMFLTGADEMVMVFVALETLSISSYLLSGYTKRDPRSNEAALKYLLVGAASSAIFLYGMSLLYGLSGGETSLSAIASKITVSNTALIISMVFVIAGVSFKLSAVPFHQWTPDVYEGSPTPVVAFLSIGSKVAGFGLALRFLITAFPLASQQWHYVFVVLTVLSIVLGNVVAIAQTSIKRMLAYSSIGQAGFVMLGMVIDSEAGYSSMVFYLLLYLFMNMGAFACVILFSSRTGTDQISEYSGLYQKDPLLTLALSVCLLSLGGIPPLAGFFGKLYIFWAGWQAHAYGLVLLALVMSVVSLYYYIRVVKMMVVKEPQEMSASVKNYPAITWTQTGMKPLQAAIVFTLIFTAIAGIASNPLFSLSNQAVKETQFLQAKAPNAKSVAVLPTTAQ
ncbi:MAG: NAD(P)H-quinone oxidoreductase subunit N [Pseudanabaena sp. ELA645]